LCNNFRDESIANIDNPKQFHLYVIKGDLKVNPIPEKAEQLRALAAAEGGLCSIEIPAYTDTDAFLNGVKTSATTGEDCNTVICRSEGCTVVFQNGTEIACTATNSCEGLTETEVQDFKNCDCDVIVSVNELNEFVLYTGKTHATQVYF
jgi:hypothetical protein